MFKSDFVADVKEIMNELNAPSGTLSFPLPMCEEEFRVALNGGRYKAVLWDLDQEMRSTIKYDAPPLIRDEAGTELSEKERQINEGIFDATEYWRDRLWVLLGDQNVSLYDE